MFVKILSKKSKTGKNNGVISLNTLWYEHKMKYYIAIKTSSLNTN